MAAYKSFSGAACLFSFGVLCSRGFMQSSPNRSGGRKWGVRGTRVCVLSPPLSCKSQLNTPAPLIHHPLPEGGAGYSHRINLLEKSIGLADRAAHACDCSSRESGELLQV